MLSFCCRDDCLALAHKMGSWAQAWYCTSPESGSLVGALVWECPSVNTHQNKLQIWACLLWGEEREHLFLWRSCSVLLKLQLYLQMLKEWTSPAMAKSTSSTRPGRPDPPPAKLVKTGSRLNIWCRFCVRKKYKQVWWALKIRNEFFVKYAKLKKLLRAQCLLQCICFGDLKQISDFWLYKKDVWGDFFKAGIQVTIKQRKV